VDSRQFLASSLSASALTAGSLRAAAQTGGKAREYYELRRYQLQSGPQRPLADGYFRDALIPGLNRLGISPVGVFSIDIGEGSPSLYVLVPSASLDTLVNATFRLEQDTEYLKAGAAFLNTPATQPDAGFRRNAQAHGSARHGRAPLPRLRAAYL
jgi:hypothetical protein